MSLLLLLPSIPLGLNLPLKRPLLGFATVHSALVVPTGIGAAIGGFAVTHCQLRVPSLR